MRVALSFGGIAALSALAAAIVLPPRPVTSNPAAIEQGALTSGDTGGTPATSPDTSQATVQVQRQIRYVQLLPGQTAPPGARVIDASAPAPVTVVVNVAAPVTKPASQVRVAPPRPAPTPIIIKTNQSGTVVP